MRPSLSGRFPAERGTSSLLFALMLLFTVGTLALATDLARLFVERARLEQAAAAAARGAVAAAMDARGALRPEVAIAHARASTRNLETVHAGPHRRPGGRTAELVFPRPNTVTVTIRQSLTPEGSPVVCAARLIGIRSLELRASASAAAPAPLGLEPAATDSTAPDSRAASARIR